MKVLNLGSLNLDRVYTVDKFVDAGETIQAKKLEYFCGGKGLNQSIALAKAGAEVYHAGAVGKDGAILKEELEKAGVHIDYLQILTDIESGHAVIQVVPSGQNCIIVCKGANGENNENYIDRVLGQFSEGDMILLQNEISNVSYAIKQAKKKGMKVAFNPSPITEEMYGYPLEDVDYFILNEYEGKAISGCPSDDYDEILQAVSQKYRDAVVVMTIGEKGCICREKDDMYRQKAYPVTAVDTTAAGDTFCGYFLAGIGKGIGTRDSLDYASRAAAMAVEKMGAAGSIPFWQEVEQRRRADEADKKNSAD